MDTETLFIAIGHASFIATFLSFAQKSLIRLRIVAVVSFVLGLVYNGWANYHMVDSKIGLVVFWLAMLLALNVALLIREIAATLEVSLPVESRELLVKTFPAMHSRDWVLMLSQATKKEFRKGDKLLLSLTAVMEPPMFGVMEPRTGS